MSILLETKRLVLKKPELSDLNNLLALRSDPEVMKYIGDGSTQTEEEVMRFLNFAIPYQEKYRIGFCSVFEKKTGNFVGQAGLFHLGFDEAQNEIEIAYRLHKKFWGMGYATELVKVLIQWGFQNLPINKLIAVTSPDNLASQRVLIKAGLKSVEEVKLYNGKTMQEYEIYK